MKPPETMSHDAFKWQYWGRMDVQVSDGIRVLEPREYVDYQGIPGVMLHPIRVDEMHTHELNDTVFYGEGDDMVECPSERIPYDFAHKHPFNPNEGHSHAKFSRSMAGAYWSMDLPWW